MKYFASSTKKAISLLIAAILLCTAIVIPSSAAEYIFTVPPTTYSVTDLHIGVNLAGAVNGLEFKFCAVPKEQALTITIDQLSAPGTQWFVGTIANTLSSAIITKDYTGAVIGADKEYRIFPMAHNTITNDTTYTIDTFVDVRTLITAPRAPLSTEIVFKSATYTSLTFEVQPANIEYSTNLISWTDATAVDVTITGLSHTTSFDCFFRFKAAPGQAEATLETGKVLKITASTLAKPPFPTPAAPATSDYSAKTDTYFSVVYLEGHTYYVNGKLAALEGTSLTEPGKDYVIQTVYGHKEIVFINLTPNTSYTVTCKKNADENNCESAMSPASAIIRTKRVPSAPASPTTKSVTDTKIEFNYVSGVEYAVVPTATPVASPADIPAANWVRATENANSTYVNAYVSSLTPATSYSIYSRVFETSENVTSAVTTPITIITKQSAKAAPEITKINVIDKSTTRIIVQEFDGIEFRIGKTGATITYSEWQASGIFSELTINTNYTIQARYTYNTSTQMPSEIVTRTTFTSPRIPYAAGINNTSIKRTDGDKVIRATDVFTISAKGDTYSDVASNIIMGDTRLIPVGWYTSDNTATVTYFTTPAMSATFNVKAVNEGKLTVFVIYENQKWMGSEWVTVKDTNNNAVRVEGNISFNIESTRTTWTNVRDFFVGFINVFTNTIPALLIRLFALFA